MLRAEQKRYRDLCAAWDRDRMQRHDFRHDLLAIEGMAKEGMTCELVAYVDELTSVKGEPGGQLLCADPAADAVASYLSGLARDAEESLSWHLLVSERPFMSGICIRAVLGSLVENAIAATAHL